jgi:hypothetical protein
MGQRQGAKASPGECGTLDAAVLRTIVAAAAPVSTDKTRSAERRIFMMFSFEAQLFFKIAQHKESVCDERHK